MRRRPPISTRTHTLYPYPPLVRTYAARILQDQLTLFVHFDDGIPQPQGALIGHAAEPQESDANQLNRYLLKKVDELELSRSEEHTSELQSLMRISYAVFCLTKKNIKLRH